MRALNMMAPPITGQCLCGEVTYICSATPIWSVNCHCHACQKLSGGPYVSAFSVPADSFAVEGATTYFQRISEAGNLVTTWHCAGCGGRVNAQSAGATTIMNVFASTLHDTSKFTAVSNVYLSEAAPWIVPPDAPFNFQKMPERASRQRE